MSRFFEAASKDNLLEAQDVSDVLAYAPEKSGGSEERHQPSAEVKPVDLVLETPMAERPFQERSRPASLRVPTSAPVFPFFDRDHSPAAEQYRIIRTKILHSAKKPRLLVVTSPSSGDGKTVSSINIAASFCLKENMSVLLVDADLRRPAIADLLGISCSPGLAEVLSGGVELADAIIHPEQFPNLSILPSGEAGGRAAELLHSHRWVHLIEQFRAQFEMVIMDATPVAVVADYELVQHNSDGIILVLRPDHTDRKAYLNALQTLPKEKLVGIVLNCVKDWFLFKTSDYYYYGKKSRKGNERA